MMIDLEASKRLHEAVAEVLDEVFPDEPQEFILLIPEKASMVSNVDNPLDIAAMLSGVVFSLLTGSNTRRMQNAETGEEVKAN